MGIVLAAVVGVTAAVAQNSNLSLDKSPAQHPKPWSAYVSTGDHQWVSELFPVDSAETIGALFEVLAKTYGVKRVYWRGEQDRMWLRYYEARPENPRYYDFIKGWLTHLNDEVGANESALAAARRHGMEIYIFDGLFEHGSQGDAGGCGMFPYQAEDRLRLEHPEWRPIDRWGECAAPGPIEFCYPEARHALVQRYLYHVTHHRYDGIAFYTYVENTGLRYPDEFGFNEPLVREFQRRHGVNIRTQPFDRQAWHRLRGEYVTDFLRELHAALSAKGKKLSVSIVLRSDGSSFPQAWPGTGVDLPGAGYVHLDWETWVKDRLVDELIVVWPGDFDAKPALSRLVNSCKNKAVELSVLVNRGAPSVSLWAPFLEAGLTPITVPGNVGVDRLAREPASLASLQSKDWRVRAQALADVAEAHLPTDLQSLVALLQDSHVLVRRQLLLTLAQRKANDQVPILEAGLDDPESSVRIAAANALAAVNGPETPRRLLNALAKEDGFQMKEACVKALLEMKERAQTALLKGLSSPVQPVREVCVRTLAQNGSSASWPALISALHSDLDYRIRFYAARGLSHYAVPEAVAALLRALHDSTVTVQLAAADTLGSLAKPLSEQQRTPVLSALENFFREFGDGCKRSDAAWGWRIVGNALIAFAEPGKDKLETFRVQPQDRWLAWAAYQVLYVPQVAHKVELVDEQAALETHRRFAPPFPGHR